MFSWTTNLIFTAFKWIIYLAFATEIASCSLEEMRAGAHQSVKRGNLSLGKLNRALHRKSQK